VEENEQGNVDEPVAGHVEPAPEPERLGTPEGYAEGADIPGHPEPSPIRAIQKAAADAAAPGVEGYQDDPTLAQMDRMEPDPGPVQASGAAPVEGDPAARS
jgi:hypothetical protein